MRLPDEDHHEIYRRLISIANAFCNVGAQHIYDFWIKDKYIDCMMPYKPIDGCTRCKLSRWLNKIIKMLGIVQ
jgi:hypothetical protein